MLDRLTGKPVHLIVHLVGCTLLGAGLPASKIPLSLATMLLVLNLLLEGDFRNYRQQLKATKLAWPLWAYIACEWLSLTWTSDWHYALIDLNAKLPLYAICLVLVCKPIRELKHLYLIIGFFLASLFVTSVLNVGSYFHWWGHKVYDDIRGLSLFASHIRYGLMIGFGIALSIAWIVKRLPYRILPLVLIGWWSWYTYLSQVLSGYIAVGMVLFTGILFALHLLRSRAVRISIAGIASVTVIGTCWWLADYFRPAPHRLPQGPADLYTVNGNWYRNDTTNVVWEDGEPVVWYLSEAELEKAWNARSAIDYRTGKDRKQQLIPFTLWRYMTSKHLRKDSVGFRSMTKADIRNVEEGIASVKLLEGGLKARLYGIKHQVEHPENPNGHSLLQRLEYWKAASTIIARHPVFGVGAGDVQQAFEQYYAETHTRLEPNLQRRAHNQYMTSWISSGIPGFCCFLLWWLVLLRMAWTRKLFLVMAFALIAMTSFLTEDTIETQVGVTFIALFYALFAGNPMLVQLKRQGHAADSSRSAHL